MTTVDNRPLYDPELPFWVMPEVGAPRREVTVSLPEPIVDALLKAQDDLGIAASDLVAYWVKHGAAGADNMRRHMLDSLMDTSRITGWLPSGAPTFVRR